MRQWNMVAAITGGVTLLYVVAATVVLIQGAIKWGEFSASILPVMTAWGGYLASFLPKRES